jgi:hypothetical protein
VKGKYGHNAMATAVEITERQFNVPEEALAQYEISDAPNTAPLRRGFSNIGDSMNIYTKDGWPDMRVIRGQRCPFIAIVGGRGTGKTYSTLENVLETDVKAGGKFIYLRRTMAQVKMCCNDKYNPFRKINHNTGRDVHAEKDGDSINFLDGDGQQIGSALALSTVSNIRGIDAHDTTVIVFDEFIRDKSERRMKGEAEALFNFYETVNRNRELEGQPPVQLIMLANANDSANAVFMYLHLVMVCERQKQRGIYPAIYKNVDRGILLIDFGPTNEISQKKAQTALYKLTAGTAYADMALKNQYTYNDPSRQASRPLKEYLPVVFVGELAVYQHKSGGVYYCTNHKSGAAPTFGTGGTELQRFRRAFAWLWLSYLDDKIEFENYAVESLLTLYFEQ